MINFRKIFYVLRTKGFRGVKKFFELNTFENKILKNKKVKWCDDGYWSMDPMPSQEELNKYYQEVYWFSNASYKAKMLVGRDLKHAEFIKDQIGDNFFDVVNFMNYGAGHGGVSYLFHPLGINIFNVEPGGMDELHLNNFHLYESIEELSNSNPDISFDLIYSSHALEHLRDPLEFLLPAIDLLNENGRIILEVPNTRIANPDKNYFEGGCDGKTAGSHTIYYTKDFFENLGAKIFFYGGDYNKADYPEVSSENNANFIRAVIDYKGLKNYLSSKSLVN